MNQRLRIFFALILLLCTGALQAQSGNRNFDHVKTGYALTGVHTNARCESCHIAGVFKGTPKECASCHTSGTRLSRANITKPSAHFQSPLACDSCHTTATFVGAKFDHAGVAANACASCHNGATTVGKPSGHIQTTASCGSCHKTSGWLPASGMDHAGFTSATNCASCHNGSTATGKTAAHIPTSLNCTSCHTTSGWKPSSWNHGQVPVANQCSTCHSGSFPPADGPTANHIPYKSLNGVSIANCDSCHKGGTTSWSQGQFHANVPVSNQCATCHMSTGFGATGRPATAIHNGQTVCENCHKSTSTWSGSKPDHSLFNSATNCASCHNGSAASGKAGTHLPTALNCVSCHTTAGWKPTNWNHSQMAVANQCATCHTGGFPPASGPTGNHIPYKSLKGVSIANCDSCHKGGYTSWNPGQFHTNVSVSTQCATCHMSTSFGATGRPATAIHNGQGVCENCHKSTSTWLGGAKPDHSGFTGATNCVTCHNGSSAAGKTAAHFPTSANCISCHNSTGWKPTKWNHSQAPVANQCSTCHTGGFPPASGLTANHIPYKSLSGVSITNCDSCHKAGYSSWNPGQFHSNVSLSTQCATCHLSSNFGATARPATAIHNGQTVCENCHKSTSTWLGSKPDHSLFTAATNCSSCHNGSAASGKVANHIPTSVNCVSCHNTSGWKPAKWNHSQMPVANQCSTCHSGAYPPADGKTANHIPYQSLSGVAITNCDSCHKAGYSSWNPGQFHSNVSLSTQCATCHMSSNFGATARPATAIHNGQTVCENCHKSTSTWLGSKPDHSLFTAATNCSSCHNGSAASGKIANHIPTSVNCVSCHNVTGWKPTKWNHSQMPVTNQCTTCHSGAYPPADGKPANHIPYQSLSGVAITNCDSCHKAGTTSWNPGLFHNNVSLSTQCATCHMSSNYGLSSRPATAIHNGQTVCENCHKSTSTWLGSKPDHSLFTAATNCSSCHNGSAASGKIANHIPTSVNCVSCHNVTGWKPTKWNHSQMPVTNQCTTCHSGAYPPADGKTANHIPYQSLSGVAITNCDSCHKSGYTSWIPTKFHTNVSLSTQCATCHMSATYGLSSRPATAIHNGQTVCENCHKSTTTWLGSKPDHSLYTAATNCSSCHNGSAATGKVANHIPTSVNCVSCHNVTGWKPTKWNHTQMPVTNQCTTCHSGAYPPADGRPVNHIPYQSLSGVAITNCDSCHKSGYASWNPGRFHSNVSITTQCATCHLTAGYGLTSKPATATHSAVTGNCESCHRSTSSWLSVQYTHAPANAVGTGTCDNCHNGSSSAVSKPPTHIPVPAGTAKCDSCHKSQVRFATSVTMNHSVVTMATCKSCHNGSYLSAGAQGALAKPANHIPEATQLMGGAAMDCNACHSSTTSWLTERMNHNSTMGNGAGWCKGCHATGTTYLGSMEKKSLNHEKAGSTDCSQSGCHRPLGNKGATYSKWN